MNRITVLTAAATLAATCNAQHMGGPMKHVMIGLDGNSLTAMIDPNVPTPVLQRYWDEQYEGNASVLNDTWYNAQYGWMIEGAWQPPQGAQLWIEQLDASPNLLAYLRMAFDPIFGTDGSSPRILWDGTMMHNWYASAIHEPAFATYLVYLGDDSGEPINGYDGVQVDFVWNIEPCPADLTGSTDPDDPSFGVPDGSVDATDFFYFLDLFAAGTDSADINDDGTIDADDFFDYLDLFALPC